MPSRDSFFDFFAVLLKITLWLVELKHRLISGKNDDYDDGRLQS